VLVINHENRGGRTGKRRCHKPQSGSFNGFWRGAQCLNWCRGYW
jgi:hypothetical protein